MSVCPDCGKAMGEVLCVHCGYDSRTGRRTEAVETEARPTNLPGSKKGILDQVSGLSKMQEHYRTGQVEVFRAVFEKYLDADESPLTLAIASAVTISLSAGTILSTNPSRYAS